MSEMIGPVDPRYVNGSVLVCPLASKSVLLDEEQPTLAPAEGRSLHTA
jgi:hypothetical protein